jgi:hypothetical protein
MERTMAKSLHNSIAIVILSATLSAGGASVADAHHGDAGDHSKKLSAVEMEERQITAELNRKQLMLPQLAALEAAPQPPEIVRQPEPAGDEGE